MWFEMDKDAKNAKKNSFSGFFCLPIPHLNSIMLIDWLKIFLQAQSTMSDDIRA